MQEIACSPMYDPWSFLLALLWKLPKIKSPNWKPNHVNSRVTAGGLLMSMSALYRVRPWLTWGKDYYPPCDVGERGKGERGAAVVLSITNNKKKSCTHGDRNAMHLAVSAVVSLHNLINLFTSPDIDKNRDSFY